MFLLNQLHVLRGKVAAGWAVGARVTPSAFSALASASGIICTKRVIERDSPLKTGTRFLAVGFAAAFAQCLRLLLRFAHRIVQRLRAAIGLDAQHAVDGAHLGRQHLATEPRDQCILAILAAAWTVVAGEPHHRVRPFGEGWSSGDH